MQRINPAAAKAGWSVVLEKPCANWAAPPASNSKTPPAKQQIACTRSFGRPITELQEAITEFACRAAEKLRKKTATPAS